MNFSVNQMEMSGLIFFRIQVIFWSSEWLKKRNIFAKQENVD